MLITFEGIDGSGKTTVSQEVAQRLNGYLGYSTRWTHLPGETELGKKIREMVLAEKDPDSQIDISPSAELLLYLADRAQCLEKQIIPWLTNTTKTMVICDRFDDSTRAYQGGGRNLGVREVDHTLAHVPPIVIPNLTILLRVPLDVGLNRKSGKKRDRMESQDRDFYERVNYAYSIIGNMYPHRIVQIDATKDISSVTEKAVNIITRRIGGEL